MDYSYFRTETPQTLSLELEAFFQEQVDRFMIYLRKNEGDLDQRVTAQTHVTLGKTALSWERRDPALQKTMRQLSQEEWQNSYRVALHAAQFHMAYSPPEKSLLFWECLAVKWPSSCTTFWTARALLMLHDGQNKNAINESIRILNDVDIPDDMRVIARYVRVCAECRMLMREENYSLLNENMDELYRLREIAFLQNGLRARVDLLLFQCLLRCKQNDEAVRIVDEMGEASPGEQLKKLLVKCGLAYETASYDDFLKQAYLILQGFIAAPGDLLLGICGATGITLISSIPNFSSIRWNGTHEERLVGLATLIADVERRRGREELAIAVWQTLEDHPDSSSAVQTRAKLEIAFWDERANDGLWPANFSISTEEITMRFDLLS